MKNEMGLQEIRNPQSIEQVPGAGFLLAVILSQIDELEDVVMPGLDVDGECAWTLVPTLVDITGRRVIGTQHGDDPIRVAVSTSDIRPITSKSA